MTHRLIAVITAVLVTISTTALAGWEYTAKTSAQGGEQSQAMNSTIRGWADGPKSKVEFVSAGNPMTPQGSYLVSKDGGKTIYIVNPREKKYSKWDMQAMMDMAGGAMEMMGIKFSTPKVEKLVDEKGPKMLGFKTQHYRFRTTYTMSMNFMGMSQSTETEQIEDVWTVDELDDEGLNVWLNQQNMRTGNKELDKLLEAEMGKISGFPLKRVVITTEKQADGPAEKQTITTEITSLRKASPSDSEFTVPSGYTEQQMFPAGSGMPQGGSSQRGGRQRGGQDDGENPLMKMMQQFQQGQQ